MFTAPGSAWPSCLTRSANATVRRNCVPRQPPCLNGSTRHFGMMNSAFMPMHSTAIRRKSSPSPRMPAIAFGLASCLASGPRLLWTGWGIRTLSAGNPAFNPYNYQTGSVWPHDNGIIAMGFKLYGFGAEAGRIAHDISIGASHFLLNQLPELYTAFPRDETTFPVQYIGANVPQAWAAGSIFMLTQAMLGFLPDAPRNKLYVDPLLPEWLPDITIRDLRVGQHKFDIRFWREGERTEFEVLDGNAKLVERCEMGP